MKKYYIVLSIIIFSACTPTELTPSVGDIQTAIAETEMAMPALTTTTLPPTATSIPKPSETPLPSPTATPSDPIFGTINVAFLNLREGPGTLFKVLGTYAEGTELEILPPTATSIPKPSETPLPSPTATPSDPIFGIINVAFLNLRAGPSTLFEILGTYAEGTELEILGKIEDSNWTKVIISQEDEDEIIGWMSGDLLDIEIDLFDVPVAGFPLDQSISGQISLSTGEAINNVNVTVTHRINEIETRHIATSNENGLFVAYYPKDMQGLFDVQITGVLCTSSILDDNCQLVDYFKLDSRVFISIPQTEEIQFYYEAASGILKGSVVNSFGNPVPEIVVAAERDDGAESSGRTDFDGNFSIPIGEGIWEVYALIVYPRNEGDRVSINITDQIPSAIVLDSPN